MPQSDRVRLGSEVLGIAFHTAAHCFGLQLHGLLRIIGMVSVSPHTALLAVVAAISSIAAYGSYNPSGPASAGCTSAGLSCCCTPRPLAVPELRLLADLYNDTFQSWLTGVCSYADSPTWWELAALSPSTGCWLL